MKNRNWFVAITTLVLLIISLVLFNIGIVSAEDGNYKKINKPISVTSGNDVESIPQGSYIHHLKNGETRVYGPDEKLLQVSKTSEDALIFVPNRGSVPASHVHYVPTESRIGREGDEIKIYQGSNCILTILDETFDRSQKKSENIEDNSGKDSWPPPAQTEGWIEYSRDWDVDGLVKFQADWYVPNAPPDPTSSYTLNYIFNAIEPSDTSDIIQPVLEYNVVPGTHTWTCAAWYGIDGSYIRDNTGAFSTGQNFLIRGTLSIVNSIWKIDIYSPWQGKHSILYCNEFTTGNNLMVFCALEGKWIYGDGDVCGYIEFSDMLFQDNGGSTIDIGWSKHTPGSSWGIGLTDLEVNVVADNNVELYTAN